MPGDVLTLHKPTILPYAPSESLLPSMSEVMVIAAIVTKPAEVLPALELEPEDIEDPSLRAVLIAAKDMANSGQFVDPATLADRFEIGSAQRTSLLRGIASIGQWGATSNWREHQAVVLRRSLRNQLRAAGGALSKGHESSVENIIQLQERITTTGIDTQRTADGPEVSRRTINWIEQQQRGNGKQIPTGLSKYDEYTGGLHETDLTVIAGRPAKGKTAFAITVATNACKHLIDNDQGEGPDGVVGIISSEQSITQIGLRLISRFGKINLGRFRQIGSISRNEWPKIISASGVIRDLPIRIDDTPSPNTERIRRQAFRWAANDKLRLLVVDYIQRIAPDNHKAHISERIGKIAMDLKNIAKELDIPVLALAQLSRSADDKDVPQMSDLAGSSEIEKEADAIGLIYKPSWAGDGKMAVRMEKNRHGQAHVDIVCRFDDEHTTWCDE